MGRWRSLFGTLIAVTLIVGIEHAYLWWRLVAATALSPPTSVALTVVLAMLALSVPVVVVASRVVAPHDARWWATPVYTWLGVSVVLTLVLLGNDLAIRAFGLDRSVATGVALMAGLALSTWAAIEGRRVRVRRVEVRLAKLPAALDGLSLVQLSDVHLGPTLGADFLESVVRRTNELGADAVVVTGDLVDAPVEQLVDEVAPLARLEARFGTYFVTGNHEYHAGVWVPEIVAA